MKKKSLLLILMILLILSFNFTTQLMNQNKLLDKKSIIANTLSQYISKKENTKCEMTAYSGKAEDNWYKITCDNGVYDFNIDLK
jgi:peptidoglycan hydrolase CwlO-like protein